MRVGGTFGEGTGRLTEIKPGRTKVLSLRKACSHSRCIAQGASNGPRETSGGGRKSARDRLGMAVGQK